MAKCISGIGLAVTLVVALQCSTALAQVAPAQGATAGANSLEEVVVTAQRREQTLETTPVAVSVLGADALARNAIVSESDLQFAVPGLTVKAGQDNNQLNYSLRGQTVDAFSSSRPSVLPYVNEVQVGGAGSSAFYDLASVQVLKGPQGTLFGRNSTGGAVLFTTAKPTNELGGYLSVRGGNYNDAQAEGALNVPLITDKVLLRVAGFFQRRDGFQDNLFDNSRLGEVRRQNARVSLTVKPTESFSNDLVIDYAHAGGNNLTSVDYNIVPLSAPNQPYVPANFLYTPAVDSAFGPGAWNRFLAAHPGAPPEGILAFTAEQQARGPFRVDVNAPSFHKADNVVVSNVSALDLSSDTKIKNIIGYTHLKDNDASEFDGTPYPIDSNGDAGRGGTLRQFSEELQLLGNVLNHELSYVSGFYFSDERDHTRSLSLLVDLLPAAPPVNQINDGVTTNKTYAGYAQGTFDLSNLVGLKGLGFTAGGRYSSEKVEFLHLPGDVYITSPVPPGATFVNPLTDTFKKVSWQFGLQEQLNPDLLLYVVSRRSFRSGGFNFFAPPLPGFGNDGGSEYKPETATDVEIGAKFRGNLGDAPMRLNIAAYNMWVDDIQRSNYVSIFGSLAGITVNVPKAEITGLEIDGLIAPTQWLTLGGSLNATDARFTSDIVSVLGNPAVAFGPYPDTPKRSATVYAEVVEPVTARLSASLRADMYAQTSSYFSSTGNTLNPGSQIPGYGIANFRLGIEDTGQGWSLSANLKNAFNKVYYAGGIGFASLLAVNTVIPGDPRTITVEGRYKF
jgi:iron complex outermembrane receptor protein